MIIFILPHTRQPPRRYETQIFSERYALKFDEFQHNSHKPQHLCRTTKIHALVNEHFQIIGVDLTGGEVHDGKVAIRLLSKITLEGKKVLADKAFCSEEIREYIYQEKAAACISDKSNTVNIHDFDKELYKARNIIERFFQRIKTFRHIATRYDKLSDCFLNFVFLASFLIQI